MDWKYALFCPPGLRGILEEDLNQRWKNRITPLGGDESLLVCSAEVNPAEVVKLPFPSFLVISQKEFSPTTSLSAIINSLVNPEVLRKLQKFIPLPNSHHRSFRVMASKEGKLIPLNPQLRRKIENQIRETFHLQHNPQRADNEFWIIIRREGLSFFGLRLRPGEKRERGELSAAVAYLLNAFSQPKPEDVFLDPFAGTGAIAVSRARYFPTQRIIASDNNPQLLNHLKQRLRRYPNTQIFLADALNMNEIPDSSVDVIVTDPPWGEYQPLPFPAFDFYQRMLAEFKRVIKENGRIVVLIGRTQKEDFEKAAESTRLSVREKLNVLIAGRKANIYLFDFKSGK